MDNSKQIIELFSAIRNGKTDVYRMNIDIVDINVTNEHGQSLLHESIAYRQWDVAIDLICRGIECNIQDCNGQTVLHFICSYPNIDIAKKILKMGGDINQRDKYGNNAMWTAVFNCKGKSYEIVKLFKKFNPDINTKNNAGRSPLDFAQQIRDEKLMKILCK